MTRRAWTSIFTAAAMAVSLPVLAQDSRDQGQRPNTTGSSSGSAASRPSGGSGGSSGGGAVSRPSSGSSGGSSVSGPSGVSRPSGGGAGYEGARPARPERRTGALAVPRSSGDTQRAAGPAGATTSATAGDSSERRRAVPAYSRPRDGRPAVGTAVNRTRPPYASGAYASYFDPFYRYSYYSSRYPYGYYLPGYAFGVGYFYDPWMWGYASPYGYGGYHDPYAGSGGTYSRRQYRDTGSLRLKVKPEHGQVYVDGYYVGEVDSFDGVFQRLTLDAGAHRIEIRAEGYETAHFEVMVIAGETVTYKGDLGVQ